MRSSPLFLFVAVCFAPFYYAAKAATFVVSSSKHSFLPRQKRKALTRQQQLAVLASSAFPENIKIKIPSSVFLQKHKRQQNRRNHCERSLFQLKAANKNDDGESLRRNDVVPLISPKDESHTKQYNRDNKIVVPRKLTFLTLSIVVLLVGIFQREALLGLLHSLRKHCSPANFRDTMVPILDRLNDAGIQGQITYTLFLMLWTMTAGITTPVETAAGIAFGVRKGIICNAIGKVGGAILSFVLGRYLLYQYVHRQLKENEVLQLVEGSIEESPLAVSLMVRFSPLPELVKNCGLAVLNVRKTWFVAAVILHGVPFTCLWTCLGAETASVMRGSVPSATLKIIVTGATWFGKWKCYYFLATGSTSKDTSITSPLYII